MSNQTLDLEAIKARTDAATEGPWHWAGNTDSRQLYLATWKPGSGRCTVMDQSRWGMQGAKPQFVTDGLYVDGDEIAVYEVARNQGLPDDTPRSHPRIYRGDVVDLNHPDAKFIAAARQDVPALVAEVERLRGVLDRVRDEHSPEVTDHGTYCVTCSEDYGLIVGTYPCPPIRALEGNDV